MNTVSKYCETLQQAEDFLEILYDRYESVQMVISPRFEESGLYIWRVSYDSQERKT